MMCHCQEYHPDPACETGKALFRKWADSARPGGDAECSHVPETLQPSSNDQQEAAYITYQAHRGSPLYSHSLFFHSVAQAEKATVWVREHVEDARPSLHHDREIKLHFSTRKTLQVKDLLDATQPSSYTLNY